MQLTPDLAFKLTQHWKLPAVDREYFQVLVEMDRAVDPGYTSHLREKVKRMREAHESLSNRTNRPSPTGSHDMFYFSGWHWTAIHFLTSIKDFQSAESISARLNLSRKFVVECLDKLRAWGFVNQVGNRWEYAGGEYHLSKDSPLVILHHNNWRQKAVMDAQNMNEDSLHFTNVHTISRGHLSLLKELLLKFITDSNDLMKTSAEEDCVVLLCDLFKLN